MAGVKARGTGLGLWVVLVLSLLIGLVSYRYLIPGNYGLAPSILANRFTHLGALTIHAGFAATALILGPFQFMPRLRRTWQRLHRWIGRSYVTCCLLAAVAGLLLAFGATTGPISTAGFGLLAVIWFGVTARAWWLATARRFIEHERWMIRSFALTLAAVTLRIYLPLSSALPVDGDDAYRAISFLAWVPNLLLAELYLARFRPLA